MPTSAELLNSLYSQYTSVKSRPVRTDEQRRQQAENEYKSYYDALRLAAQQGYDSTDLKLQQQLSGLQQSYDNQRKNTAEQYAKSYSQADRQMLSRGMQRSTYTSQLLAGINNEAAEAQGEIDAAQTKAANDLNDQRTQLAAQLASQMNQYTASQQSDILKRIAELEEQDRQYSLNETSMQSSLGETLYAMLKEKEDADAAAAAAASKKSSGGGYTPSPADNVGSAPQSNFATFMSILNNADAIKNASSAVRNATTLVGNTLSGSSQKVKKPPTSQAPKKPAYSIN